MSAVTKNVNLDWYIDRLSQTETIFGVDHPFTLRCMNNLAIALLSQGEYDEAEVCFLKCLERRKKLFGNDHSSTLDAKKNLETFYKSRETHSSRKRTSSIFSGKL